LTVKEKMNINMRVSQETLYISVSMLIGTKNYFLGFNTQKFKASQFDVNPPFKQARNLFMIALSRS